MCWTKLLSKKRFSDKNSGAKNAEDTSSSPSSNRSEFAKDYDRVIFSYAFRRLGRKTQVHPLALNDHIHTRMTHSLEVASVGRSLGYKCGEFLRDEKNVDFEPAEVAEILQAACLAHDIGNPPFEHAGEEAIRDWFRAQGTETTFSLAVGEHRNDFDNFEGNAQGFRILNSLENHASSGGMRLTYATLASILKYPWSSVHCGEKKKFGCFHSELPFLQDLAKEVGLIKKAENCYARHPLAHLSEAADDICYRILDIEDAFELRIIDYRVVKKLFLPVLKNSEYNESFIEKEDAPEKQKIAYLRSKVIGVVIDAVMNAFKENYEKIMQGDFAGDLIDSCTSEVKNSMEDIKNFARDNVFNEQKKLELEIGCYTTIGVLLDAMCAAVDELISIDPQEKLSYKAEKVFLLMVDEAPNRNGADCSHYKKYLKVTDFVSGMTDRYALHMARQISGIGG